MTSDDVPIRRVLSDGTVEALGSFRPRPPTLLLERPGYPLLAAGEHSVEGDLPWVFDEVAPDGYLAARFTEWFPQLGLPKARSSWSAAQVLAAISRCGHDLGGNLLIGEETFDRFGRVFAPGVRPGPDRDAAREQYGRFVEQYLRDPIGSSVGGSRPKFALRLVDGTGVIVKFTPPLLTHTGRRWSELLRIEAHAAETLRAAGVAAVCARYLEDGERGFLEIDRFDRVPGGGRRGHVTLYHLGIALFGEIEEAGAVIDGLVQAGQLDERDRERFRRVDAFSRAIGNTDTHLGNYGLVFGDDGRATLAPAYDVLPMKLAPRHDELPDRFVTRSPPPADDATAELVCGLRDAVRADDAISDATRACWESTLDLG